MNLRTLLTYLRISVIRRLPDKPVQRTIQGVDMVLPRRHLLPVFAGPGSPYGVNLVELARRTARNGAPFSFLDVGANVGDSTLMVLDAAPGTAVCVEPDPEWLPYLDANVGSRDDVEVESALLLGPGASTQVAVVHESDGSSRLERTEEATDLTCLSTDELLERHPSLREVSLIKTDTDGYDVMLVPELVRTFGGSRPIVFFEFDPRQTALATPEIDATALWGQLIDAGYEDAAVWTNGGDLLHVAKVSELEERARVFDRTRKERGFSFWDVAVAHRDNPAAREVIASFATDGSAS